MNSPFLYLLFLIVLSISSVGAQAQNPTNISQNSSGSDNAQPLTPIPAETILVKGAWSSASDSVTPVPEAATVAKDFFSDPYFGITYTLPSDWTQEYEGPPPSESGRYVLAQIEPSNTQKETAAGSMLITAQDMFFAPLPSANAAEFVEYLRTHLQADYKVETAPTLTRIAGHSFSFFSYWSPAAELHWYVLAIQIRCHTLQIVLTSRDTKLLDRLLLDLNKMTLPENASAAAGDGGGAVPVCIKDYARDENVVARVDPIFAEHRFNAIPVRIIIDKEGKVKHVHFISAFPDQAKAIIDALQQWKFKSYLKDGKPVEVETGILFGQSPHVIAPGRSNSAASSK
jgi:hypothetical protein